MMRLLGAGPRGGCWGGCGCENQSFFLRESLVELQRETYACVTILKPSVFSFSHHPRLSLLSEAKIIFVTKLGVSRKGRSPRLGTWPHTGLSWGSA